MPESSKQAHRPCRRRNLPQLWPPACSTSYLYSTPHLIREAAHVFCSFKTMRKFDCVAVAKLYWLPSVLIYGWNCPGRIFSPNIVTFFATLTPVFKHFLHWFYCFYYFYGSITCARVGKTKFLTRHLRLGTWKKPLNMDDFEVFSHFFPFCISSYKP